MKNSSWETSSRWYDEIVGQKGHYYHQHLIIPSLKKTFKLSAGDSLLDVGCGSGVAQQLLKKEMEYLGIDLSPSLVKSTQKRGLKAAVHDATKPYPKEIGTYSHAISILALQNMEDPKAAIEQMAKHFTKEAVIVLNHPCFRIPRQTRWEVDEKQKIQYRRIDLYKKSLKIPIQTNPGIKETATTYSFHFPLSYWFSACHEAGLFIKNVEEWFSDKTSTGKSAKMENRARAEFPLFLAIHVTNKSYCLK